MPKKEKLETLQDLYCHELKDVLSAEKQITKALPKLIKNASSDDLRKAFEKQLKETAGQIQRLEKIFQRLEEKPSGPKCAGMEGILKEGEDLLKEDGSPETHDAGMIVAAQKVEHYEIAAYGSLCTFAKRLGYQKDLELLKQTLNEEEMTDKLLSELAESEINEAAESAGENQEELEEVQSRR